jgi:hypothetical protein
MFVRFQSVADRTQATAMGPTFLADNMLIGIAPLDADMCCSRMHCRCSCLFLTQFAGLID